MSEYHVAKKMPAPEFVPDHAFVPEGPGDRYMCRHVETYADQQPVYCNLKRAAHPVLEDEVKL